MQMWKAGWAAPLAELDVRALTAGAAQRFTLPATHTTRTNLLRIVLGPDVPASTFNKVLSRQRALYLAYRVKGSSPPAYDAGLQAWADQKVWCGAVRPCMYGAVARSIGRVCSGHVCSGACTHACTHSLTR